MARKRVCIRCKAEFWSSMSPAEAVCCGEHNCPTCATPIRASAATRRSRRTYCSRSCADRARPRRPKPCTTCHQPYTSSNGLRGDCKQCRTTITGRCRVPTTHPARTAPPSRRTCDWCNKPFSTTSEVKRWCDRRCKQARNRVRRRGEAAGSQGHYTWTEVIHLHILFNRCCAYCHTPVDQPDPDHVVPLSRGGHNTIGNILPACRLCNSDKRDLLLHEWAADRARRHLPSVTTTWDDTDPRFRHLTAQHLVAA